MRQKKTKPTHETLNTTQNEIAGNWPYEMYFFFLVMFSNLMTEHICNEENPTIATPLKQIKRYEKIRQIKSTLLAKTDIFFIDIEFAF